jgi:starch synthase
MYIVQIASECAPVIKAGGLGDVVYGLSRELEIRGNCVELILPKYDCMRYDHIWGLHDAYRDLWVPWYDGQVHCSVYCGWVHGRVCFFIEPHSQDNFFNRGCYYGCDDDNMRFAFFSKAALEFLHQSNKRPAVIHCHDWQTGLVPVMLYEIYKYHGMGNQRVCYTIHNFKHQGIAGNEVLQATGLNRANYYFQYDKLRDNFNPFAINLMKGGIVYSNAVTTVSPNHAWEARFRSYFRPASR